MAKKKEVVKEKFLTEIHLVKLENGMQKQQLVQGDLRDIDYRIRLIKSDIEILKANIKLKENMIRDYQRMVPDNKNKINKMLLIILLLMILDMEIMINLFIIIRLIINRIIIVINH